MKLSLLLILLCFFVVPGVTGQEKAAEKWTRLESRNREVSAAFPPGYIVDTLNDAPGLEAYIFGYKDGVHMVFQTSKNPRAKDQLKYMPSIDGRNETNFNVDKMQGRRIWSRDDAETFHETTYLASDSHFYVFIVRAPDSKRPAVERFLYSIQVKAKPLYIQKEKKELSEELISLEKIQSSAEVVEAYKREYKKREIKVDYLPWSSYKETDESGNVIRPVIVLEKGKFDFSSARFPITEGTGRRTYQAKLKIHFLANGEIGDITVYSDESLGYMTACVESFRKAKFIPAWKGDKNIDYVGIEECIVSTTTVTSRGYIDRPNVNPKLP